ncbi:SusC/RagA family TonB-linked outer membrane protein [Bacteroidia bacterium]|nr:SusC/RagA family TonB-linked outer membrane protein [Bacteroidia bacterium]
MFIAGGGANSLRAEAPQDAKIAVTGVVSDAEGPIIGASVTEAGNPGNGTATDVEGKYSLRVSPNATIAVAYLGYSTQEVPVNGQTTINVALAADASNLDEVVVIGYGSQKRAELTSAIGSASGKVLENRPIATIGEGLQGVIPNLQIVPGGTAPGQGASFNIRGYTSLNGGGPLILVDGVVQDPNLVNPNDIESVSVLKDAASSAIYGARAAYGVVLFTTKSGKKNQKPTFNFSSSWATSSPINVQHSMNSLDYVNLLNMAARNEGVGDIFDANWVSHVKAYNDDPVNNPSVFLSPTSSLELGGATNKYAYSGNTDWADVAYKNGGQQQYSISMSGGSESTRYFVSYGFLEQQGILATYDDSYQRHTINMDLTTDINKWLTFGAKAKYTYGYEDHPVTMPGSGLTATGGVVKDDLPPIMPIRHPDGNYAGQGVFTNPFTVGALGGYDQSKVNDLWITGKLALHLLTGLNVNADFTFNPYSYNQESVVKRYTEKHLDRDVVYAQSANNQGVTRNNSNDYYTAVNVYTDYAKSIDKNNFKLTVGYNQEIKTTKSFNAKRIGLINQDIPMLSLATGAQTVDDAASSWAVQGAFGRLHYDYDTKYLIDINGRYDGSSRFAKGHRFAIFPSVSAAWYLSHEEFMEGTSHILSDLKLRGSYGSLGNQLTDGNFLYVPKYGVSTNQSYLIDGARGVTVTAPGLVSADFTWEKVTQWNAAVDFGFLQSRLNGSFDVFTRNTIGMLTESQALPGVLGTGAPKANAADLKTVGWELELKWNDRIKSIGLDYHASFVLSDALAEITKYNNPTGTLATGHYIGKQIGEIWGYESNGLFQSDDEIASAPSQSKLYGGTWLPGDVRYVNKNGDDVISNGKNTLEDHGDLSIIGNTTPRYQYGITLGGAWKGFDLDIFLQGVGKRDWNPDRRFYGVNGQWQAPPRDIESYWTEDTPNGFLPKMYLDGGRGNREINTRYLQDASYLRFKQLSVGYTLPANLTRKASLEKVRVYFTGQNLFTWTNLSKMYDPEIIGTAASSTGVANNMTYPVAQAFSFGLNVTF